jgi:hypothetical protein
VIGKVTRPEFVWDIDSSSGDITVQLSKPASGQTLKGVHMWHATTCNSERRDFRLLNLVSGCIVGTFAC